MEQVLAASVETIGTSAIDADTPLMDAGLDSLGATALRSSIQDIALEGTDVPATLVFDAPTPRAIVAMLTTTVQALAQGGVASYREVSALSMEQVLAASIDTIGTNAIDADTPLMNAGLDSLGATALRSALQDAAPNGADIPATLVFDAPTPRAIVAMLTVTVMEEAPMVAYSTSQGAGAQGAGLSAASPVAELAPAGWVLTTNLAARLSDDMFPTIWYSFPMTYDVAAGYFDNHASIRTSFIQEKKSGRWRWKIGVHASLSKLDATSEHVSFTDRGTPVFYGGSHTRTLMSLRWPQYQIGTVSRARVPAARPCIEPTRATSPH